MYKESGEIVCILHKYYPFDDKKRLLVSFDSILVVYISPSNS